MVERPQLLIPTLGVTVDRAGCDVDDLVFCGAVQVRVGAEEDWASLVDRAVDSGWAGVEALSAIDGRVGEVTRANAAAFGQAVSDTVVSVRSWDRRTDAQRTFPLVDCDFRPGGSRFQEPLADGSPRYLILDVAFLFRQADLTAPVDDGDLADLLGVRTGQRVHLADVREALRGVRPPTLPAHEVVDAGGDGHEAGGRRPEVAGVLLDQQADQPGDDGRTE